MRGYWISKTIGAAQTAALLADGETVYEPTSSRVMGASSLYGSAITIDNVRVNQGTAQPVKREGYNLVGSYNGWDIITKDIELANNIQPGTVKFPVYNTVPEIEGCKTKVTPNEKAIGGTPLIWKKAAKLIIAEPSTMPSVPWSGREELIDFLQGARNAYISARQQTNVFGIPDFPQNIANKYYGGSAGYVTMKQNTKYVGMGTPGGSEGDGKKINSPFDWRPYLCKFGSPSGANQVWPATIDLSGYEEGMLASPLDNITCLYPGCLRSRAIAHNANEKLTGMYGWNNKFIDAYYTFTGRVIPCGVEYGRCNRQITLASEIGTNSAINYVFGGVYKYKLWLSTLEIDTYGNEFNAMGKEWYGYYADGTYVSTLPYAIAPNLQMGTKAYKGDGMGSLDSALIDTYITPWYRFTSNDPLRYCYMINNGACCWVLIYHTGETQLNSTAAPSIPGNADFIIV